MTPEIVRTLVEIQSNLVSVLTSTQKEINSNVEKYKPKIIANIEYLKSKPVDKGTKILINFMEQLVNKGTQTSFGILATLTNSFLMVHLETETTEPKQEIKQPKPKIEVSMKRRWTKKDIQYIKDNYGTKTNEEIAKHLHRSPNAIGSAAFRANLSIIHKRKHKTKSTLRDTILNQSPLFKISKFLEQHPTYTKEEVTTELAKLIIEKKARQKDVGCILLYK